MFAGLSRKHYRALGAGVVVGIGAGIVVSVFRELVKIMFLAVSFTYRWCRHRPGWCLAVVIVNLAMAVVIDQLMRQAPATKGSGIPQVEGQLKGQFHDSWWPVLWRKFIISTLTVGSGIFMGHEGPSIQLGGAAAQGIAKLTHQNRHTVRLMIAGGAAAGLTAVFNTPVASSLFVLESVYHNLSTLNMIVTLSAALVSNLISVSWFGIQPLLYLPRLGVLPVNTYGDLLFLGLLLGFAGYGYKKITLASGRWLAKLRLPFRALPALPLLLVIPVGIFCPQVIGSGTGLIMLMAKTPLPLGLIGIYLILRILGSTVSFGCGMPGGIFLPILTLGAILSALYANVLVTWCGLPGDYRIDLMVMGMAGFFACTVRAPFTAVILIAEMVGTLHHLAPLALVVIAALATDDLCGGRPLYDVLLARLVGHN